MLVVHNPGPATKIELMGMTGDGMNDLNFQIAKDAILAFEKRKLNGPVGGGVLIYHEDNGQLCLLDSAGGLHDADVIDDEELTEINKEIRLLKLALQTVAVVVLMDDSDGKPALFPCLIECSKKDRNQGRHYRAAQWAVEYNGNEPVGVFDENDPAFAFLDFSKFGALTTYNLDGKVASGG